MEREGERGRERETIRDMKQQHESQKVIKVTDYTNAFNHITFNTAQQAENENASIKVGFLAVLETQGSYTVGDSKLRCRCTSE